MNRRILLGYNDAKFDVNNEMDLREMGFEILD
jgi:hypothetical protein